MAHAEARARSPAPSGVTRTIRHHIHIPHLRPPPPLRGVGSVGQPSSSARMDVARDMIRRARTILDRLDNPDGEGPNEATLGGNDGTQPTLQQAGMAVPFGAIQISAEGEGAPNTGELHAGLAQAISGIVQGAISGSLGASAAAATAGGQPHGQPGQPIIASVRVDSFSMDPSGQVVHSSSNQPPSQSTPASPSASPSTAESPTERSQSAQELRTEDRASQQAQSSQRRQPQLEYPSTTEMAAVMDEYRETNDRLAPHWNAINEILRSNSVIEGGEEATRRQQVSFNQVTHVMHLMSHAQHAISDMMVNFNLSPPRVVRSRPIILQPAGPQLGAIMVPMPPGGAPRPRGPQSVQPRTAPNNTQQSGVSRTSTQTSTANSSNHVSQEASAGGGLQVSAVTPIVVGIEVEGVLGRRGSSETGHQAGARAAREAHQQHHQQHMRQHVQQHDQAFLQSMIHAAIGGMDGSRASQATPEVAASSPPSSSSSGSPSSRASTGESSDSSSQTQARGNTQTQPTTSTRTRSTTQVHYGPPPPIATAGLLPPGIPVAPASGFDPFLPCNSHHLPVQRARARIPAGGVQRPRSASVPPRREESGAGARAPSGPGTSSARPGGSPQLARRSAAPSQEHQGAHPPPLGPIFANLLQQNWDNRQNMSEGSPQQQVNFALDPSILALMQDLQQVVANGPLSQAPSGPGSDEANMMGMIQGLLGQVVGAMTGANRNPSTISEFLLSLPDYSYVEGDSMLTDFLMTLARNLTFQDVLQLIMGGAEQRLGQLRTPLRGFVRQHLMGQSLGEASEPTREEVEDAVVRFADDNYSELEEMSRVANIREGVDFAETLHSFLTTRLAELVWCIMSSSTTQSEFPSAFLRLFRQVGAQLTALCQYCFTDGMSSLERLLESRLALVSDDVGPTVRQWTLSTAVGHLRSYVAGVEVPEEEITRFVVNTDEGMRRRRARSERRRTETGSPTGVRDEDEHFATPRSSPELMETDVEESRQAGPSSSISREGSFTVPPPVDSSSASVFPRSLLQVPGGGPDVVVGSEAWHRAVPPEWVPIIARDAQTQERQRQSEEQGESGAAYSDAYLSTQPAKRRKLAAEGKPSGSASQVVRESLKEAIVASGVQSTSSAEDIAAEATAASSVAEAVAGEVRQKVRRRLHKDPDFAEEKFPDSAAFLKDEN